jgi:shikimate kinase
MNNHGITFYIDTSIALLLERLSLKGINKRPLLKKMGAENLEPGLKDKLNERLPFYTKAKFILPYQEELEKEIVLHIKSRIKSQN